MIRCVENFFEGEEFEVVTCSAFVQSVATCISCPTERICGVHK